MAAPTSYAQTEQWLEAINDQARDLVDILKGGINVGQSGQLGDLALINTLSQAPIGNLATLRSSIALSVDINDWNSTPNYNCFLMASSGSTPNRPPGASTNGWQLAIADGLYIKQYAGAINSGNIYSRVRVSGTWSPWILEYNQSNIVGTVSHSAGMPTGAIIERGENSDGEYVKFADGTLICNDAKTIITTSESGTYGSLFVTGATVGYPVSFASNKVATSVAMARLSTGASWPLVISTSLTAMQFRVLDVVSRPVGTPLEYRYTAIGRWYEE